MKNLFYILFVFVLVLASCESPLDLDTPRDKTLPNPVDSVIISVISISLECNGEVESFMLNNAMLEIDTSGKNPLIWGSMELLSNIKTNTLLNKLHITSLTLLLNKIPITGTPIVLSSLNYQNSLVRYELFRGVNQSYNKTINSDATKNKSELSFSLDRENKMLWIYLDAQIHEEKYFISDSTLNKIDSIPDVLFVKGRFKFKY